jgi:hypothetical protein
MWLLHFESRLGAACLKMGGLTMNFILDERARELHWEGHRRTDLVVLENSLEEF